MKALHFGAGNIGRGFIGKLLADAGVELTFADVNQTVLDLLNSRKSYAVHVVGEQERVESVNNVSAVNSGSEAAVVLIAEADLVTTAVGPQILAKIAGTIAKGLVLRHQQGNVQPLNIIACENMVRGTSQLKQHVFAALPQDEQAWAEQHVGFVDSAVDRIVPPTDSNDPLEVTVETFSEWIVDQTQFKGQPPAIAGMELTDNLMAFVERKLFTLNTGHAITAYLGQQAGLQTIRDAILDPAIRRVVKGAMEESGAVLIKRYGFDADKHAAYINKILGRFENPYLHDDVERVGRQPLRKLSAKIVTAPANALMPAIPTTASFVQDLVQVGDFLQSQGNQVSFNNNGVQFRTAQQVAQYNTMMSNLVAKQQNLMNAQKTIQSVTQ